MPNSVTLEMPAQLSVDADRKWLELSLAQQSVWLDAKLSGSSVYQLGGWARITAPLDIDALRQSISLVMARHDAMRLRVNEELPRQWLDDSVQPPITIVDLGEENREPDQAFRDHAEAVFASPMPLGDHPLFSIQLIRWGANLSYLLWRFHHLIADSASVYITLKHWLNAYEALTSVTPQELEPPSSYLDVIAADAAYLDSAAYHKDLAYWTSRFDPLPPLLNGDMVPRADNERTVPTAGWTLDGAAFVQFQKCARAAGATVQRALFALFALTLGRRYGQSEVVSGVALHRRDLANRHTIGMLAGIIPVRCDFDDSWSLAESVHAFSEQLDADLRHQRLSVDILSRALGLSGTGRAGLFEAAMSYIPADREQFGSVIDGVPVVTGVVPTKEASPISIHATELASGEGVEIRVAVNTDFLDAAEAGTLSSLFQLASDRFADSPQSRVEHIERVTPVERAKVVDEWNQTEVDFETGTEQGTLGGLFSAQAQRTPGALAVVGRDGLELSYAELDAKSTRLARQLVARGVCPERVVGVRMERSRETIVALLAILKAGGVYLPLDPAYPSERLDYMSTDAGALLVLDSIHGLDAEADLPLLTDPERLAYIIYTSGTTGQPKGVAVPHSAAVNLAFARRACHDPLGVGDRVLAAISVGFDVSIGQLLLPLLGGAAVVIAGDVKTMGSSEFWALLADRRVTHINSVPSFFDSILDAAPSADQLNLKRLMLGGEALSGALVARIQRTLPGVEVVNMYGPTEACIDATYHVAKSEDLSAAVLPIGRPLSNYHAYVLDSRMEPVGIGVTGELYLGGAGLARGYVNAPDLTAERFVADPFSSTKGTRLYRTGDRARWRADGCLEFLGRADQQVKIRGFRVEPTEIAAALLGHPAVGQAVVVPRNGHPGGQTHLVAYVVPRSGEPDFEAAALRAHLAQRLPDYMVPAAFVSIAAIPLNRNGKLDADALPSPNLGDGEHVAPRNPTEEVVAHLFAEVLGLARCGATDHFFELGGHSLLATSLVSKLRGRGMAVPLRAIFEAPTVELLASRIAAALPATNCPEPIAPLVRPVEIPLSFPQERIWFVDRLQQDSSYNIPIALDVRGSLDVAAAEQALERIVARHEALRTRVIVRNGRPVQEIQEPAPLAVPRIDLCSLETQAREAALRQCLADLTKHRFDLAASLPIQPLLIALEPERHVLATVIHHVAFDGWSARVLIREFVALYAAFAAGRPDPLPAPAIQYADFTLWQRRQNYETDLAYWLHELQEAPERLELSARNFPDDSVSRLSSCLPVKIDATLHAALYKLANDHSASLFMVLHAAFALLLSRWSGQDDVVIGTVTANRTQTEFESVIGCFVNTLPLRTKFEAGESFAHLLARVKSGDLAAYSHQDLPFEQLVQSKQPERSLQDTPIFQVMLVLQNAPMPAARLPGLVLEPIPLEAESAKFDLTLSLAEQDGGLAGALEFANARFDPNTIERFASQFGRVLRAVVANPERDASRIDLVDAAERAKVVEEWNRTEVDFETGTEQGTLGGLFSAQAQRTPDALAVVGRDGRELSYAELDAQSTRLARQLVARGVCPERVVGVRMERSRETIVALLAILKAGGVYLPLDPAYPSERLDYMSTDAGALLVLDSIHGLDAEADLPLLTDPERLAYIIYTSGTTGQPKGVAVPHSAAVNLAFARRACHDPLGVGDRVLAAISVGFDVSIGQLLLPLLSGAAVMIAGDVKTMGASEFWALLADRRVTHINSVPSFFDSILDAAPSADQLNLKRLMLGGEALSGALVARIQRTLPGVEVVNMYGPTEACIDATYHVAKSEDLSAAVLPIGRPLSNYRAYVLDSRMEPVGIGVTGELYLGGAGLARGYVNAPDVTAERFVADPFSSTKGTRLYRTGDRARWRADGCLEFLGRADQQVKIRGFRVEPAEIEAQLRTLPGVREAAVVSQTSANGTRLIAYFTGEETLDVNVLRAGLAAVLPDYMVPAAFVQLHRLPLSANGKLDRQALPEPEQNALASRSFVAPQGEVEQKMAVLWTELLKIERVGRHDNFFELGGHSLLAVTLMECMHQHGLPGDVRTLFTTPNIAGLAASSTIPEQVSEPLPIQLTEEQMDRIVESVPGGAANVQDMYPLSPLQEGILFQHLMNTKGDPYVTPYLLGFQERSTLDGFLQALEHVVQRHDVLRTFMVWKGVDEPLQVVLREASVSVEHVSLDASSLMARFHPRSNRLDLGRAPLLRAIVSFDSIGDRWLLLLLTHHLILDHTSLEILVHELLTLMRNPQAALPASIPYRNFIAETRISAPREEHEAFFNRLLGDVDEPTAPFGMLPNESDADEIIEGRLMFDAGLSRRIREQARTQGITPASLFHLAWAAVLGHVSGKSDVVFGTVLFGRMRSGVGADRAVGMFINTLPIRLRLDKTGVADSLMHTHELLAELMAHEHAPLALAQRCSGVAAPTPLFTSLFNYRYGAAGDGEAAHPEVEVVDSFERTNYPLAMAVDDSGQSFALTALTQPEIDADRVCQYFQNALRRLMDLLDRAPATPIETLQVLPTVERAKVVEEWNRTEVDFETGTEQGTLGGLFSAQAQRTPGAVAVVGRDGRELSYAELDAQSTRLARQLVARGVCPERVVGVRMERSRETIVALLAILKAGGVYLPLDPAYPSERLDYMSTDAGALLVLDSIHGLDAEADLPLLTDPERLAYIIYTSGTTGQPKGVAVPHSAAVNLAFARRACHDPLGVGDRVLAAISVGFDVSIGQLLLPLLGGAAVVIAGDVKTMGSSEFWALLADRRVTHINSVPSFFDSILDAAPSADQLNLKRLMLGGEALSGALVARIQRTLPGVEVVNMYGPTEACIDATYHVAKSEDLSAAVLPIGRPLSNYRAYVLDSRMEPVGIGVTGELYLGGAGLARGYVNAPDLTAERFVADPFSSTKGTRLYRTGDRARWRADGCLEFLGRADQQVKIRGFRVEPAEIEAQLRKLPGVRETAVVSQTSANGTRLIAYFTGEETLDVNVLRAGLAAVLPDYMVPAAFVQLHRLPLSANGKLDRQALPEPEQNALASRSFVAPQGEVEQKMAVLWTELLKIERVGRHDNFFELGGDSLGAMRLVNSLNTAFNVNLPMRSLFEHPTLKAMTVAVRSDSSVLRDRYLVHLQPRGSKQKLFCIHPAGGHIFCYLSLVQELGPDQPVFGLQAAGLEEGESLASSIQQMASDYIEAIREVQPGGPYQLLGMSSGGLIAYEMARQIKHGGGEVRFLGLLDTTVPGSQSETMFSEQILVHAMAGELGCADLMNQAPLTLTLQQLVDVAHHAGRLSPDFRLAQAERIANVFRNMVRLHFDYCPGIWDGPMLLLRALRRFRDGDFAPDWSPHVTGALEIVDLDCGHSELVSPALSPTVAALIARQLR